METRNTVKGLVPATNIIEARLFFRISKVFRRVLFGFACITAQLSI